MTVKIKRDERGTIDTITAHGVDVFIERMDDDEISMHIGNWLFAVSAGDYNMLTIVDMGEDAAGVKK